MHRDDLIDLHAFAVVAEEQSFTRAASRLGISSSALSHTIKRLEARLGIRLLVRTTRSVAPSSAGSQLLEHLGPALDEIAIGLNLVAALKAKPSGTIRITAGSHACRTVLWPALKEWLPDYPDVEVEISIDTRLTDVVGDRYDAGVRIGEALDKDMIAVRIGPDLRLIVVAAPAYLDRAGTPEVPANLGDHRAINLRLPSVRRLYSWELENGRDALRITPPGKLIFDSPEQVLEAALSGFGLAMVLEDEALPHLASGALVQVLSDWSQPFPGYHLYYPNRQQHSAAFSLLMAHLRSWARR